MENDYSVFTLVIATNGFAHDFESGGIYYDFILGEDYEKVKVTYRGDSADAYTEYSGNVVIPSTVIYNDKEYTVTTIGIYAFAHCITLKTVTIPETITLIGTESFYGCKNLESFTLPTSVDTFGIDVFRGCTKLSEIIVDSNNAKFDSRDNCNAIIETATNTLIAGCKNTIVPETITSIGDYAFTDCVELKSIILPSGLTSIGIGAFYQCSKLTEITIPENVSIIGSYAFYGCTGLTTIAIPDLVTTIEKYSFAECNNLVEIKLPNSLTLIGEGAFYACFYVKDIEIPETVMYIESGAFSNCQSLLSIDIPDSVEIIADYAFVYCINAKTIKIGSSVASIGEEAFGGIEVLKAVHVRATTPPELVLNTFFDPANITLYVPAGYVEVYENSNIWRFFKEICVLAESISLDKTEVSLKVGDNVQLNAKVLSEYTTDKFVVWSSSNYKVALVDENGLVTAKGPGEAIIVATTDDGSNLSAQCKIVVEAVPVESIVLDKTELNLKVKERTQLVATILPENATEKTVEWISSDESIVRVDRTGSVSAVSIGTAEIMVSTTDGSNLTAVCRVTVEAILATSIEITPTSIEAEENSEVQLFVTILPEDATSKDVVWTSSDESVATVDNKGLVMIHKEGYAAITATTTDGSNLSASCVVRGLSGISEVERLNFYVVVEDNNIEVYDARIGDQISILGVDGQIISSDKVIDRTTIITVPRKGVYLVQVGKRIEKVMVK